MAKQENEQNEDMSIQQRLNMITRSVAAREDKNAASIANKVAVSIGTETTTSILSDIRSIMNDQTSAINEMASAMREKEAREERRHKDICALLLNLSIGTSKPTEGLSSSQHSFTHSPSTAPVKDTSKFYYSQMEVRSGSILISALMCHLDITLGHNTELSQRAAGDRSYMRFNDWANICNAIIVKGSRHRQGYRLPKPQEEDFKQACSIVATNIESRPPRPDAAHFVALSSSCSALLMTVEWVRKTLIKCKGLVSPIREARLASTEYPFVTESGNMSISVDLNYEAVAEDYFSQVSSLNVPGKKHYIELILERDYQPEDAIKEALKAYKPKK